MRMKKFLPLGIMLFVGALVGGIFLLWPKADYFSHTPKDIVLLDNGLEFSFHDVTEKTVGEFLVAHHLTLGEKEMAFPAPETVLAPGTRILVTRTHEVIVEADGKRQSFQVQAQSVDAALMESGIILDEDDIVKPDKETFASRGLVIGITRVEIEEQTVEKVVAFDKKVNEDEGLSWRKTVVTQKGEKGLDQLVYRVSKHDGKEVNRKLLRTERVKDPVTEIVTQGTYVKLGKSHSGGASWYAWTGTMAAANPWLPKGSYVKVTNLENGKSVIVVINDRGPFVPGRIVDLDKVAFAKIASIGAGVINVKMEEIIN